MKNCKFKNSIEKWDVFEVTVNGFSDKNPFVDYFIKGVFKGKNETVEVDGFYDGEGVYKVRFMPSFEGEYTFEVGGSFSDEKYYGNFKVTEPSANNHGPVRVAQTYHFAYEDGTPYYSVGTTCYVWTHQPLEMQEKTLETLKKGYFNKIRFCVFPKHYDYNFKDPITFPYEGTPCDSSKITKNNFGEFTGSNPENKWDFKRFNPEHFRLFENRIKDLMDLGIEADLIIMHPYDRWGFSEMDEECDDLYWKYVIARFAAYRNVWWSLANEYDLMNKKTLADWERYAKIICEKDPYNHLRSIHNCVHFYDYSRPWVTHCSIQRQPIVKMVEKTDEWREIYRKPVVIDEMCYEGNIDHDWGNISGKELVRRFWETTLRGGYAGHGETFVHPEDKLWWSHGGELHGESPERLKFLHKILCETPAPGLKFNLNERRTAVEEAVFNEENYRLLYFGIACPAFKKFYFDDVNEYEVEVIDTWEMTIEKIGIFKGKFEVKLPGKEYMALRIKNITR
jgi:hypothetical protein